MSEPATDCLSSPAFRGEPGDTSPDAIGGWDAEASREYREYRLRQEAAEFADLYGWAALLDVLGQVRSAEQ